MKRIAFYGGSFDPPHIGHLTIARKLTESFELDAFYFVPAFRAPHKRDKKVTSAFCRYAMLALATNADENIKISTVELEAPERPYTFETQAKLLGHFEDSAQLFFVIGADSWNEITTWREWETVLTQTNIIIVTRPNYDIEFGHVTDQVLEKVVDLRGKSESEVQSPASRVQRSEFEVENSKLEDQEMSTVSFDSGGENKIFITGAVRIDVSATEIRRMIGDGNAQWHKLVPPEVANYIEKYQLYI